MARRHTLRTVAAQVEATWAAIDAMWRIELRGDPVLIQQWRAARNEVSELREMWRDLLRFADYLRRHEAQGAPRSQTARELVAGMVEARPSQQASPETLQANGAKARTPPEVFRRRHGAVKMREIASQENGRSANGEIVDLLAGERP